MPEKDSWGGPTGCEPPFVAALRAAGVEVDEEVYVYGDNQARISALQRVWRVLRAAWRLRQRAKAGHYDVIHLNTSCDEKCILRDALTLACVRSSDASIFLKMHGSIAAFLADERKFWRYWKRRVFSQADAIGVLSTEEYLNFSRAGCPSEKLVAVKNASESETFQPDPQFRKLHGLKGKTPVLLFSSRLIRTKGLLDLIKACGHLRDASQDFSLFCLGDGPARNEAEDDVRKLGLTGFVKFFGNVPEAETVTFHANATIFVFPTYHDEGFPVVLLKSLAAGLPIITTRIRGAADYL
jgi:glycosyltransferase involved in cell wall biosynthesis